MYFTRLLLAAVCTLHIFFISTKSDEDVDATLLVGFEEGGLWSSRWIKMVCVAKGKAANSALVFNQTQGLENLKYHHGPEDQSYTFEKLTIDMANTKWSQYNLSNTVVGKYGLLDFRWEEFQSFYVKRGGGKTIHNARDEKYWIMNLSFRANNNAYIYLCNGKSIEKSMCVWIILGGWVNKKSAIRKTEFNRNMEEEIKEAPIKENQWNHVTVDVAETIVQFQFDKLKWSMKKNFDIKYLIFKTLKGNQETLEWRKHTRNFYGTTVSDSVLKSDWFEANKNVLCLSFFYYIPSGVRNAKLSINIYDRDSLVIGSEDITDTQEDTTEIWRRFEKTLYLRRRYADDYVYLKIIATFDGSLPNEYPYDVFAVDDIKLCSPEGSVHTLEASIYTRNYADLPTCQLLQFPSFQLTARQPVNYSLGCGADDQPSNCSKTCKESFTQDQDHEYCSKVGICVLKSGGIVCACNRGHAAPNCLKCKNGWYGDACSEQCGQCSGGHTCHWYYGTCSDCQKGYVPPYCNMTYPKLNKAPSFTSASPNSISFNVDFTNISGYGEPTHFEIQYKVVDHNDHFWTGNERQPASYNNKNLTLSSLRVLTKYRIRVILYVNEGSYDDNDVPVFEGKTTCEDIEVKEAVAYKRIIEVLWTRKTDHLACPLEYFTAEIKESAGNITESTSKFRESSNPKFDSLEPYKKYNVKVVSSQSGVIFEMNIYTLQAAPTEPLNLKAVPISVTKSNITWANPEKPNGILKKFNVTLKVMKTWLMKGKVQDISVEHNVTKETSNYSHVVKGLSPSTLYLVTVFGETVEPGPATTIDLQTPLAEPVYTEMLTLVHESLTDSTVEITLPPASEYLTNISAYFVMVGCKNCPEEREVSRPLPILNETLWKELLNHSRLNDSDKVWIAGEIQPEFSENSFTIGNDTNSGGHLFGKEYMNHPLKVNTKYKVAVVVVNQQQDNITFTTLELPDYVILLPDPSKNVDPEGSGTSYGLVAFFLLLLIIVPIVGYFIYKRRYALPPLSRSKLAIQLAHKKDEDDSYVLKPPAPDPQSETEELYEDLPPPPCERLSCRVPITELENYVMKGILSEELHKQYTTFPRGQTQPWTYGKLPQNKPKNRYGNLVAYDHSRVILEKLPNDEHSDYINANYIDGYKTKKMYIATQGPKPNTVDDFWRMIWQEQVHIISMLANVLENGKKKCEHYWPDFGKEATHGSVTIVTENEQVFADFTLRTLKITCQRKERKVAHLHFTSWPDHGVPFYPQSVAGYLKKLLATPKRSGPILVHCSAGVGRTGTIVLADICLRMAAAERTVDVLRYLQSVREQRPNMVDNFEQFKLVHLVLIECLVEEHTSYSCNGLAKHVMTIREAGTLMKQFERLEELRSQNHMLQPSNTLPKTQANESPMLHKNRFQDIVPGRSGRVYLSRNAVPDNTSDYINAVYVDGFRIRDQFIVTQYPLPSTVGDFWRMVVEKNISLVVMLNDFNASETVPEFRPMSDKSITPVPHLKIQLKQKSHAHFWSLMKFQITDSSNMGASQHQIVRMIQLTGWSAESDLPQEPSILIHLWQEVETHYCGKGPTLVMCLDGAKASGLFIASAFVVEKIKLEQQCDVCHAVRTIRQNRKHFIRSQEQFEFLYDVALNYLEAFAIYSNFD